MGVDACLNGFRQVCVQSAGLTLTLADSEIRKYAEVYDTNVAKSLSEEHPAEVLKDVATILDRLDLDKLDGCWDTDYVLSSIEYLKVVGETFRRVP
jgi:hypothetical protein